MLTRKPLQSISIHQDKDYESTVQELGKKQVVPQGMRKSLSDKSHTSRQSESSSSKPFSSRLNGRENASSRIPFTIFEDSFPSKEVRTTERKRRTRISSTTEASGRDRRTAAGSGEKRLAMKDASSRKERSVLKDTLGMTKQGGDGGLSDEKMDAYWKNLAEDRRLALEETLKENRMLYEVLDAYKGENEALKDVAVEKEYLEKMIEEFLEKERAEVADIGTQCHMDISE